MSDNQNRSLKRRNFLKLGGLTLFSLPLAAKCNYAFAAGGFGLTKNYWEGPEGAQYCVHRTVNDSELDSGYIRARIDGWWKKIQVKNLDQTFLDWNFQERIQAWEEKIAGTSRPTAGGPHTPSVATYGNRRGRGDSDYQINNKIVGMYPAAKKEYIKEINDYMLAHVTQDTLTKRKYLLEITSNRDLWRTDVQVGLEYFSKPEFETHTFLNLMENPVVSLCFQGCFNIFTSFEVRCIAHIVHPRNPAIDADTMELAKYPSILHGFNHGFPPDDYKPAVLYYSVEEFNNSNATNPGYRVVKAVGEKLQSFFA